MYKVCREETDMPKRLFAAQEDKGGWWYCDNCGALLNAQPGFTTATVKWTCTACGEENDVSENSIKRD